MKLPRGLVPSRIVQRLNRFAVLVTVNGRHEVAHLPNSGRIQELLVPGTCALLVERPRPGRKTLYDLLLVCLEDQLVSADARLPNALLKEELLAGRLAPFRHYTVVRPEARYGDSRCDFLLEGPQGRCLVEVKSVTLVVEGTALFPDAPTVRGARHLETLMAAQRQGYQAAVVFIVQRADAHVFMPNDGADPTFGATLRQAAALGVEVYAYRCRVAETEIHIADAIPVRLA